MAFDIYWYMSSITKNTSFTVPEGLLQPNTPYRWSVRVFDSDTDPQNCRQGVSRCFYIGTKGATNLNSAYLVSIDNYAIPMSYNWFGVSGTDVAPWDIEYLKVTPPVPDTNEYNLTRRLYRLHKPAYYFIMTNDPFPMYDGDYTFEIKDYDGISKTRILSYIHNNQFPSAEVDRGPADNTYFADNPSFSWEPLVGDGPYYYRVRVWDYNEEVIWYDTEPSEDITSVVIPISGNFPRGSSYKWRLIVYDHPTQPNNGSLSSLRTFTINLLQVNVDIDIKPGSYPNCIKVTKKGVTPVAILSSSGIDLNNINVDSIEIDTDNNTDNVGVHPVKTSLNKDVDGDGVPDLVLHFSTQELKDADLLVDGNTLYITGTLDYGTAIIGSDIIYLAGGQNCF